ncbi:hypothetical protein SAMN05192539_100249 [Paraburkholderia diazotrophica]|uniref:Uncharacterized protein n=1 Tax=Paraburkholderia diazotrophica TaxID=667676 RepID=A0A1H6R9R9_9BURK|nr:hypothetical protein SAMN05192539_100249 [Paraburkholderia diazotrophica]
MPVTAICSGRHACHNDDTFHVGRSGRVVFRSSLPTAVLDGDGGAQ